MPEGRRAPHTLSPGTVPASAIPSMNLTARKPARFVMAAMDAAVRPQATAMVPSMNGPLVYSTAMLLGTWNRLYERKNMAARMCACVGVCRTGQHECACQSCSGPTASDHQLLPLLVVRPRSQNRQGGRQTGAPLPRPYVSTSKPSSADMLSDA